MGHMNEIVTPAQGQQRLADIREQERKEQEERDEAKKNRNFTQIYPQGLKVINDLAEEKQAAAIKLYTFLIKEIAWDIGAIVASQEFLADKLKVSTRTIQNACDTLEKKHALLRISLGKGTVKAYCLNPHHVWKSWDTKKGYAAFQTKTLASSKDNPDIERRLKVMLKKWEENGDMIGSEEISEETDLTAPSLSQLQEEADQHSAKKTKEYLNTRKAQLEAELAELRNLEEGV